MLGTGGWARRTLLAACCLWAAGLAAQEDDRAIVSETFGEETSVLVVEVPVRVLVRGRPARGLGAENFAVYDRGLRRELVGFEVVDLAPPTAAEGPGETPPAAALPPRSFLLLFDFAYAGGGHLARAFDAAVRLVEEGLRPEDRVAVAFFSALRGLRLLAEFTPDRHRIGLALATFGAMLGRDPRLAGELYAELGASPREDGPPLATRQEVEAEAGILVRADPYWPHRSVIRSLARGLAQVPGWHRGEPGQQHVLYLSYGPPAQYISGRGSVGTLDELERVFKSLRQGGWSIQAINVGGHRVGLGRDTLFLLAHETGGEAYENFADPAAAMDRMLLRTSLTYLLAFQADEIEADGRFHRIRVELVEGPPAARVVHRRGYYAPATPHQPARP
jgi:VWFA-related protein